MPGVAVPDAQYFEDRVIVQEAGLLGVAGRDPAKRLWPGQASRRQTLGPPLELSVPYRPSSSRHGDRPPVQESSVREPGPS
jgi:hypothetical protein